MVMLLRACSLPAQERSNLPASTEAARDELATVVQAQIDALVAGDFSRAYSFASAGIRGKFDLAAFTGMVRGSYPPLLNAKTTSTLTAADNGANATLEIRVVTRDGALAHFRYFLIREDDAWKIVGVIPIQPPTVAA